MTAKEAKMIADDINLMKPIFERIKKAANQGYYQLQVGDIEDAEIRTNLIKLGYLIPSHTSRDSYGDSEITYPTIYWDKGK